MSELDLQQKRIEYELELPNTRMGHAVSKELARIFKKVFMAKQVRIEFAIDAITVKGQVFEHQLPKIRKVTALISKSEVINEDTARQICGPN